jgi:hypothetical protein
MTRGLGVLQSPHFAVSLDTQLWLPAWTPSNLDFMTREWLQEMASEGISLLPVTAP